MNTHRSEAGVVAFPSRTHHDEFVYAYTEDALTLAYDALQTAGYRGPVDPHGISLPDWFQLATGCQVAPDGAPLRLVEYSHGPAVTLHLAGDPDVDAAAPAAKSRATPLTDDEAASLHAARDESLRDADLPLGAHVIRPRHEEVLTNRLGLGGGEVVTWTTIGAGAAPSEFLRLQQAHGAYHVAMVQCGPTRTVGIWASPQPPAAGSKCQVRLGRLLRHQGAWRYGAYFAPMQTNP